MRKRRIGSLILVVVLTICVFLPSASAAPVYPLTSLNVTHAASGTADIFNYPYQMQSVSGANGNRSIYLERGESLKIQYTLMGTGNVAFLINGTSTLTNSSNVIRYYLDPLRYVTGQDAYAIFRFTTTEPSTTVTLRASYAAPGQTIIRSDTLTIYWID